MNNPVSRDEFERRIRAWIGKSPEANTPRLRAYLECRREDPAISFADCDLDLLNECLWTYAHSRSRLWSPEGLDELMEEFEKEEPL